MWYLSNKIIMAVFINSDKCSYYALVSGIKSDLHFTIASTTYDFWCCISSCGNCVGLTLRSDTLLRKHTQGIPLLFDRSQQDSLVQIWNMPGHPWRAFNIRKPSNEKETTGCQNGRLEDGGWQGVCRFRMTAPQTTPHTHQFRPLYPHAIRLRSTFKLT